MNQNKNITDINSNLEDYTDSILIEDELFFSSPKTGTLTISLTAKKKSQIFTPIILKEPIFSTIFIKYENKFFPKKSNNIQLEKNNENTNISNSNLIYQPCNKLKTEISDIDNDDIITGSEIKFKKINVKKTKKIENKKSINEQKKKNNKSKIKRNKEAKQIKLNHSKNADNNLKKIKDKKNLPNKNISDFSQCTYKNKVFNENNKSSIEKREKNKKTKKRYKSEKNLRKVEISSFYSIYNNKNEESNKNYFKKKCLIKSSSSLSFFPRHRKKAKKHSAKLCYPSSKKNLVQIKSNSHHEIDEKKVKTSRKIFCAFHKKENSLILKNLRNSDTTIIKNEIKEKANVNNNCFQILKRGSAKEININKSESSDSLEIIQKKEIRNFSSIDVSQYKNSFKKNKNETKNYKYINKNNKTNKNLKDKINEDVNKQIGNNNPKILRKRDKEVLSKKRTQKSKIQNSSINTMDSVPNCICSYRKQETATISSSSFNSNKTLDEEDDLAFTKNYKQNKRAKLLKISEEDIESYSNKEKIDNFYEYLELCLETIINLDIKSQPRCKTEINFNFPKNKQNKKIALFDLDETLIHCVGEIKPGVVPELKYDHKIEVNLPMGRKAIIGVNERPLWRESLDRIKDYYNIVI